MKLKAVCIPTILLKKAPAKELYVVSQNSDILRTFPGACVSISLGDKLITSLANHTLQDLFPTQHKIYS